MFNLRISFVIRGCIYIIRVNGRDESDPYAYGMYAADCSRTPTFTHVHPLWCVIAFIQFGADNRVQPMFILIRPLWCVIAFIQFGVNGHDESAPTPTECALRIIHVHQHLPTCTHCDAWLHLYNSVWTGTMNRPLRLRNVRCGLFTYTHCRGRFIVPAYYGMYATIVYAQSMFIPRIYDICPRTPIAICGCIYIIRCGHSLFHLFCFSFVP